jgi:hypothetical protein
MDMTDHVIIALKGITLVNPAIGNYRHEAVRQMALETSCLLSADDAPLRAITLIAAAIPFQRHSCHHVMVSLCNWPTRRMHAYMNDHLAVLRTQHTFNQALLNLIVCNKYYFSQLPY